MWVKTSSCALVYRQVRDSGIKTITAQWKVPNNQQTRGFPPLWTVPAEGCEWMWWQCLSTSQESWTQEPQHQFSSTWEEPRPINGWKHNLPARHPHLTLVPQKLFFFPLVRAIEFSCGSGKIACARDLSLFPRFSLQSCFPPPLPSSYAAVFAFPLLPLFPGCHLLIILGLPQKTPCKQPTPWNTQKYFCNAGNSAAHYTVKRVWYCHMYSLYF